MQSIDRKEHGMENWKYSDHTASVEDQDRRAQSETLGPRDETDVERWDREADAMADLGRDHGRAAATWVEIDSTVTARAWLQGILDCDPEILDAMPAPDLGLQWSDSPTPRDLFEEAGLDEIEGDTGEAENELLNAYADAYSDAVQQAVEKECRAYLAADHACMQCGAPQNPVAAIMGAVCGSCCRKNHRRAVGQSC
jgi:hypothetical protein